MSGEKGDWIRLLVKYRGKCASCGKEIPAGEYALWSRTAKAIKHVQCGTGEGGKGGAEGQAGMTAKAGPAAGASTTAAAAVTKGGVLDCFICGRPAGCAECAFETVCDRQAVSQACICNTCMGSSSAYENYQQAFLREARRIPKVKI